MHVKLYNNYFWNGRDARPIIRGVRPSMSYSRPRLGTKIKKFAPPGSLSARSDSSRKNRPKIINYRQKLSMFGRIAVSPPEKRCIPGCMLVP